MIETEEESPVVVVDADKQEAVGGGARAAVDDMQVDEGEGVKTAAKKRRILKYAD